MNKSLFSFLFLSAFLFLFSCSQDPYEGSDVPSPDPDSHVVSVERALSELRSVLVDMDGQTRSGGSRVIGGVESVKGSDIFSGTRSGAVPDVEELVYIANFENDEGYAILAADDRLESILAIVDKGSLSPEEFAAVARGEYEDAESAPVLPEVAQYAARFTGDIIGPPIIINPTSYVEYGDWIYSRQYGPFLPFKWDQELPYNLYCPAVTGREYGYAGCVAVALGQLITINAYKGRYMLPSSISGWVYDTSAIRRSVDILSNNKKTRSFETEDRSPEALAVASLLRGIGAYVGMNYTPTGSSAYSSNAAQFLSAIGYRNVALVAYTEDQVYQMTSNNLPVYIEGWNKNSGKGHTWVIDGLYRQQRRVETYSYPSYELISITFQYRNLFHCNYGWSGKYDGYYFSGVFTLNKTPELIDSTVDKTTTPSKEPLNYNSGNLIIVYNY